jgi:DNA-binding transcriptional LysR family regulator
VGISSGSSEVTVEVWETTGRGGKCRPSMPAADPLARRRSVGLADLVGRTLAVDRRTGTTGDHLWPDGQRPAGYREVHGVEDLLTLVVAGQAIGMTSAATTHQHQRPGVVYRRVRDAPPIQVLLAWWREDPPPGVTSVVTTVREAYAGGYREVPEPSSA